MKKSFSLLIMSIVLFSYMAPNVVEASSFWDRLSKRTQTTTINLDKYRDRTTRSLSTRVLTPARDESQDIFTVMRKQKAVTSVLKESEETMTPLTVEAKESSVSAIEKQAFNEINNYRETKGLSPLKWDERIAKVAREYSAKMAKANLALSHDGFDARMQELQRVMDLHGMAENIAYNNGYNDPAAVAVAGWIDSRGHRENIEGDYSLSGLGVVKSNTGRYYLTQIFIR